MLRTLAFAATLVPLLLAQQPPQLVPGRKVVTYEQGGLWWASHVLHTDGSVWARGNPAFGSGSELLVVSGVNDLARLDGATVGAPERVAMVGANGVAMVQWNTESFDFDVTTWNDAALLGGLAVRTAHIGAQYLVAVLLADGSTLRFLRGGGQYLATFAVGQPVLDFEVFGDAAGNARVLVLTGQGLRCTTTSGVLQWSLPGSDGDLLRWPAGPARAGWVHHAATGAWRIDVLGDGGSLRSAALGGHLANNEVVVAVMAADCDGDAQEDLIVKTPDRMFTLRAVQQPPDFVLEGSPLTYTIPEHCVPDLACTHGGRHVHLVDFDSTADITQPQFTHKKLIFGNDDTWMPGINVTSDAQHSHAVGPGYQQGTRIDFDAVVTDDWLDAFSDPTTATHLQVVAWLDENPDYELRGSDLAQSNRMSWLSNVPNGSIPPTTAWPLQLHVETDWSMPNGPSDARWDDHHHYWLTVRLVETAHFEDLSPLAASDPVSILVTMARAQDPNWDYVRHFMPNPLVLPFNIMMPNPIGGGIVGVITWIQVPPPPSIHLPSPREAEIGAKSTLPL